MRRAALQKEKAKRKKIKTQEVLKDVTGETYNEIIEEMGDNYYKGYVTEDDEEEEQVVESEVAKSGAEAEVMDEETKNEMKREQKQDQAMIPKSYVMSCRSPKIFYWDVCIIVFAVLNAVILPMEIAFMEELEQTEFLPYITTPTTVIFIVDIVAGFFTSFILVSSGDEIFGLYMIAENYIFKGSFPADFISSV